MFIDYSLPSDSIDQLLGFHTQSIENKLFEMAKSMRPQGNHHTWGDYLHQGNLTWVGLDPETMQTPYQELKLICDLLKPASHSTFLDLGAGYGRLALVLNAWDKTIEFKGYELVEERVDEGNRIFKQHGIKAKLYQQDLTHAAFQMPEADFYFLYDYGKIAHIRHTLNTLSERSHKKFKLIARGKGCRSLIHHEFPWLTVNEPMHEENFFIYSSF